MSTDALALLVRLAGHLSLPPAAYPLLPFLLFALVAALTPEPTKVLILGHSAGLQVLNPKSWSMALLSVCAEPGVDLWRQVLLALAFLLVSAPCLGFWALLGSLAVRRLGSTRA